jgi:hypothetical protein
VLKRVTRLQNAAMILDNMVKDIVAACEHFDIERFIPRLSQFLAVPHVPHKRRFLIDWTSLLQVRARTFRCILAPMPLMRCIRRPAWQHLGLLCDVWMHRLRFHDIVFGGIC